MNFVFIAILVVALVSVALLIRIRGEIAALFAHQTSVNERLKKSDAVLDKLERRTRQMQMENYRIRKKLGVEQEWLKEWGLESEIEFLQTELDELRAEKVL